MESNKEIKNEIETKKITDYSTAENEVVKKDNREDMKKYITKIDNRIKTKVNFNLIIRM